VTYQGNTINWHGCCYGGNESIRYGKCTATDSFTGSLCSGSTGPNAYLWGTSVGTAKEPGRRLIRGKRQTRGGPLPQPNDQAACRILNNHLVVFGVAAIMRRLMGCGSGPPAV